jgi:hypothetical protein
MENILRILDVRMPQPTLYGWFHIVSLLLTVAATVLLCRFAKEADKRKIVLTTAILVTVLEVYKQINFSFSYADGIRFDYQWYAFPFQFCSTPMYVGLLAGLTKQGKLHNAACAYLATYAVFAGICVMLYPSTVFVPQVGINIQTMVCHGSMIVIGAYLLFTGYVPLTHRTILRAIPVFAVCVAIACGMNEIAHLTGLLERETFDMFFISPYGTPSLPVYSLVQGVVPFPWCLVIYVAAFTFAAYLMLLVAMGIKTLVKKKSKRQNCNALQK